jgi:hypothetical protein
MIREVIPKWPASLFQGWTEEAGYYCGPSSGNFGLAIPSRSWKIQILILKYRKFLLRSTLVRVKIIAPSPTRAVSRWLNPNLWRIHLFLFSRG